MSVIPDPPSPKIVASESGKQIWKGANTCTEKRSFRMAFMLEL